MKVQPFMLAALSIVALLPSTNASAQRVSATPAAMSWSGFYAGLNAGGAFGGNTVSTVGQTPVNISNVAGGARPAQVSIDRSGVLGGVQVGYGRMIHGLYLGVETDADGARMHGQQTVMSTSLSGSQTLTNIYDSNLRALGTVRARVGRTAGRFLLYGTGGFAYGLTDHGAQFTGAAPVNTLQFFGRTQGIYPGWSAGGGAEYRASRRFSYKAEYLKFHLEEEPINIAFVAGSGGLGSGYNAQFQNHGHALKLGINYRF